MNEYTNSSKCLTNSTQLRKNQVLDDGVLHETQDIHQNFSTFLGYFSVFLASRWFEVEKVDVMNLMKVLRLCRLRCFLKYLRALIGFTLFPPNFF